MPEAVGGLNAVASAFASGGYRICLGSDITSFAGAVGGIANAVGFDGTGERFGEIDEGTGVCDDGAGVGIWTSRTVVGRRR